MAKQWRRVDNTMKTKGWNTQNRSNSKTKKRRSRQTRGWRGKVIRKLKVQDRRREMFAGRQMKRWQGV